MIISRLANPSRIVLALATACGVAVAAPALAEGGDMARLASIDAQKLCGDYADQTQDMRPVLEQNGWALETPFETPHFVDLSATRDYDGLGTAYFYGFVESYPSEDLVYCSFDIYDALEDFDITAIATDPAYAGEVIQTETGAYGSWEKTEGTDLTLVQSYRDKSDFRFQITRTTTAQSRSLTPATSDGTGQ